MVNTELLKINLKILALKAVSEVERRGIAYLKETGEKLKGKGPQAVEYVKDAYAKATAATPLLNQTTIDDDLVGKFAQEAVDWAWGVLGDTLNRLSAPVEHAPTDDASLPPSTDQ